MTRRGNGKGGKSKGKGKGSKEKEKGISKGKGTEKEKKECDSKVTADIVASGSIDKRIVGRDMESTVNSVNIDTGVFPIRFKLRFTRASRSRRGRQQCMWELRTKNTLESSSCGSCSSSSGRCECNTVANS